MDAIVSFRLIPNLLTILRVTLVIASVTVCFHAVSHAQLSGDQPRSWQKELRNLQRVDSLPVIDIDSVLTEDARDTSAFQLYRIGAAIPFNIDVLKVGQWDTIPEVGRVCRLALHVPEALSICLNYSSFRLPKGGMFFVYNPLDTSELRGAFREVDNQPDNHFATGFIRGQDVVLEYFELLEQESGSISLGSVVHIFRGTRSQEDGRITAGNSRLLMYGDSKPCNINIKCPQGAPYDDISRSVVMMVVDSQTRSASGALVNNVRNDKKPYILTAGHVYAGDPDVTKWLMYFNYFQPLCDSLYDGNLDQVVLGSVIRAHGDADSGDFALVEAVNLPSTFDVYFAGWNRVNSPASSTVCIHHPEGDVQKISFGYSAPYGVTVNGSPFGDLVLWEFKYHPNSGTGIVEDASSGAPLFDQNSRIVGQHTFASAPSTVCGQADQIARFGKFARAWADYSPAVAQLKAWLDPDNTGATVLNGLDTRTACCVGTTGNYDADPFESVDIGDLVVQVNFLFQSGLPPACWDEGNCDGDSNNSIDIADLTLLVDHLFINFTPLANCP